MKVDGPNPNAKLGDLSTYQPVRTVQVKYLQRAMEQDFKTEGNEMGLLL